MTQGRSGRERVGYRVAFVGSHSTGKTTLAMHVESVSAGTRVTVLPEVARIVIARGYPLGKDASADAYVNYVRDQLEAERVAALGSFELLVSDRTVLDCVGYARVNRRLPRPYIQDYFISMLEEVALREAEFYDLHVYFPVEWAMEADGVRPEDEQYREEVGGAIMAFLAESRIPSLSVSGTTDARMRSLRAHGVPV